MYSILRRAVRSLHKNAAFRISRSSRGLLDHQSPFHHRFTTFYVDGSLRRRHDPHSLTQIHVRAISYSSIARSVVHAFRIPIAGAIICVGLYTYANYKFEELKRQTIAWTRETAQDILESASDRLKAVSNRVRAVELREAPQFLQNLVNAAKRWGHDEGSNSGDGAGSNKWSLKDNASAIAADIPDNLKAASDRVRAVELSQALQFLKKLAKRLNHDEESNDGDGAGSNKRSLKDKAPAIAADVLDSLKPVSDRVRAVHLDVPQFLKNVVKRQHHDKGSNDGDVAGSNKRSHSAPVIATDVSATMSSPSSSHKSEMVEEPPSLSGESGLQQKTNDR